MEPIRANNSWMLWADYLVLFATLKIIVVATTIVMSPDASAASLIAGAAGVASLLAAEFYIAETGAAE